MRNLYRTTAVVVLNTLLMLVALNLVLALAFWVRDRRDAPVVPGPKTQTASGHFHTDGTAVDNGKRTSGKLLSFDVFAYEDVMTEPAISAMLDEFYDHGRQGALYQPFSQTGPRVFEGTYLNVSQSPEGFALRKTTNPEPGSLEPIEIFAFGGSTTFGLGLTDAQTWPSQLSRILNERARALGIDAPVIVTNFGRTGFYPTQELHQLINVLRSGLRPELVVFLDGVNYGRNDDSPNHTFIIADVMEQYTHGIAPVRQWLPMVRLARGVQSRLRGRENSSAPILVNRQPYDVARAIEMFLQAKESAARIADQYGAEALFVLQPDAIHNYPDARRSTGKPVMSERMRRFRADVHANFPEDQGYLDLRDLFEAWAPRKAVIDAAHYSPNFTEFLARHIADEIDLTALAAARQPNGLPTGAPRAKQRQR